MIRSRGAGRRQGFTVLGLITVLAFAVGFFSGYFSQINESRKVTARIQAITLENALNTYFIQHGKYPAKLDELLKGKLPILENRKSLVDPWGRDFVFEVSPDGVVSVWSNSPYGKIGNKK